MKFSKIIYIILLSSILVLIPIISLAENEIPYCLNVNNFKIVDYITLIAISFIVFVLKVLKTEGFRLKESDVLPIVNKLSLENPD